MRKGARKVAVVFAVFGVLLIFGCFFYQYETSPTDSSSKANIEVEIPSGTSTAEIASTLKKRGLIRNETFFKVYVRLTGASSMKAATYILKKNMTLEEIVSVLEKGTTFNNDVIRLTFKEGKTIEDYAKMIASNTNITEDIFLAKMKDQTFITSLIKEYWFLEDIILNEAIYYPLEGYLAPDTYEFKNKDVTCEEIIRTLLDQETKKLEPYKALMNPTHDALTLASMAELEGVTAKDRKLIVSVFQNRLQKGMNLGSDVTTYYAFHQEMTSDLTSAMFNTYNPYNTRSIEMSGRLPIGPICNPSKESIDAVMNPTATDALFFVADKNGKVYYTKTEAEHIQKVNEIKEKGDWIW